MRSLIPFLFIALFVYLIFFRKGGMGCCGGHMEPEPRRNDNVNRNLEKSIHNSHEHVIDLREDEYTVISQGYVKHTKIDQKD
ncbi:MAG TPA: hypothetical protein HPQ03_13615 [Deltaproteobacteria bacterium]|nr:hypothetical protein [Deltaproteobacteria bacterium]